MPNSESHKRNITRAWVWNPIWHYIRTGYSYMNTIIFIVFCPERIFSLDRNKRETYLLDSRSFLISSIVLYELLGYRLTSFKIVENIDFSFIRSVVYIILDGASFLALMLIVAIPFQVGAIMLRHFGYWKFAVRFAAYTVGMLPPLIFVLEAFAFIILYLDFDPVRMIAYDQSFIFFIHFVIKIGFYLLVIYFVFVRPIAMLRPKSNSFDLCVALVWAAIACYATFYVFSSLLFSLLGEGGFGIFISNFGHHKNYWTQLRFEMFGIRFEI